jgi:hypothetical protein
MKKQPVKLAAFSWGDVGMTYLDFFGPGQVIGRAKEERHNNVPDIVRWKRPGTM